MNNINEFLTKMLIHSIKTRFTKYAGSHAINSNEYPIEDIKHTLWFEQAEWEIKSNIRPLEGHENIFDVNLHFKVLDGICDSSSVGVVFEFDRWSRDNFVLLPAAAYNGNRFVSKKIAYPPMFEEGESGLDMPVTITDVPRLNIEEGFSRIQQLTGDLATPAIGFFSKTKNQGFWLLTTQDSAVGDLLIEIEESFDREKAQIAISLPGVRQDKKYTICSTEKNSTDKGHDFIKNQSVTLKLKVYSFDCNEIQGLYDYYIRIRKDVVGEVKLVNELPLYSAWKIIENKYNLQNWEEEYGYYSVGMRDSIYQDWQVGWVGGIMSTYPMLTEGCEISKERALRTFDFLFSFGQAPSGLFYGCLHKGKVYGDNFVKPEAGWHLIRKSSDALYFLVKQFMYLEKADTSWQLPKKWEMGTKRCADAIVKLWNRYGQFGQFVDSQTGELIAGGTACASTAPAGLALAGQYFNDQSYLNVAKASAMGFYKNFVKKGFTNGGPGDMLQCPDSESAFGMLESFVVLYETTGESFWLQAAREQANQCSTWLVSYNFKFSENSTFGILGIRTVGSVYANVQNKHSAPGICTLSGDSLFKLFRYTGDIHYLYLIKELAHNITQYLSREDKPIKGLQSLESDFNMNPYRFRDMPSGWMNERINMSDWLEPVGEVFYGSCWCEVSCMLTYIEVPGVYIQPDTGFISVIDHIELEVVEKSKDSLRVKFKNPTKFEAKVKVFSEMSWHMDKKLGQNSLWGCQFICLAPGEEKEMTFYVEEGVLQ